MSRVGLKPIVLPAKVQLNLTGNVLNVKGPKGELNLQIPEGIDYKNENNEITFGRNDNTKSLRSIHGLTRALVANAVEGVANGIKKVMKIEGVGYKVEMKGKNLMMALGFSHPILVVPPPGIEIASPNPTTIEVSGISKQLVGQTSAVIRKLRKPEPYKGKGIRYEGEYVRRKAGKTATK